MGTGAVGGRAVIPSTYIPCGVRLAVNPVRSLVIFRLPKLPTGVVPA